MLIDWFTVAAQALNFLILVWLMRRFLYQPILHAIDAREKRIADELADADRKKAEAKQERDDYEMKSAELDNQRASLLSKAAAEAANERQHLMEAARKEADELSEKRAIAWQREQLALHDELTRRTTQEVFAIARMTLSDLAGASLEERMVAVFSRRVRELDDETKISLGRAISSALAVVRTAFDLPAAQRDEIKRAVDETFSADIKLTFATSADLVSGIELSAGGQKVAWSIADHLATLKEGVDELIKA